MHDDRYDYSIAINRLLEASRRHNPEYLRYLWSQPGPNGEQLFVHRLRLGSPNAKRVVCLKAGLHGAEGDPGMGAAALILEHSLALPDGVALDIFFPLEPWAHANQLRNGEFEPNRANIAWSKPGIRKVMALQNARFERNLDVLFPKEHSMELERELARRMESNLLEMLEAGTTGQSNWPGAISFTGPPGTLCESGTIIRSYCEELNAAGVETFADVDAHTGVGIWAKGAAIAPTFRRRTQLLTGKVFGLGVQYPNRTEPETDLQNRIMPIQGTLQVAMENWLECRRKVFVSIEFGPGGPRPEALQTIIWRQFIHNNQGAMPRDREAHWINKFIDRFRRPDDKAWQVAFYSRLVNVLEQAMLFAASA